MANNENLHYTDREPIQYVTSHTHIDQPIIPHSTYPTVTWVNFIDFRDVKDFNFMSNKGSIGGTWLQVLERFQGIFNDIAEELNAIKSRLSRLETNNDSIKIYGPQNGIISGDDDLEAVVRLSCNENVIWSIESIDCDSSYGVSNALQYIVLLSNSLGQWSGENITLKISPALKPDWTRAELLGNISWVDPANSIKIDKAGSIISATYTMPTTKSIRYTIKVKATSRTVEGRYAEIYLTKTYNNPHVYINKDSWSWSVIDGDVENFSLTPDGEKVTIKTVLPSNTWNFNQNIDDKPHHTYNPTTGDDDQHTYTPTRVMSSGGNGVTIGGTIGGTSQQQIADNIDVLDRPGYEVSFIKDLYSGTLRCTNTHSTTVLTKTITYNTQAGTMGSRSITYHNLYKESTDDFSKSKTDYYNTDTSIVLQRPNNVTINGTDNYEFYKWYSKNSFAMMQGGVEVQIYKVGDHYSISGKQHLYAVWKYTITLIVDPGWSISGNGIIRDSDDPNKYYMTGLRNYKSSNGVKLPTPVYNGSGTDKFSHWKDADNDGISYKANFTLDIKEPKTLCMVCTSNGSSDDQGGINFNNTLVRVTFNSNIPGWPGSATHITLNEIDNNAIDATGMTTYTLSLDNYQLSYPNNTYKFVGWYKSDENPENSNNINKTPYDSVYDITELNTNNLYTKTNNNSLVLEIDTNKRDQIISLYGIWTYKISLNLDDTRFNWRDLILSNESSSNLYDQRFFNIYKWRDFKLPNYWHEWGEDDIDNEILPTNNNYDDNYKIIWRDHDIENNKYAGGSIITQRVPANNQSAENENEVIIYHQGNTNYSSSEYDPTIYSHVGSIDLEFGVIN